MTRVGWSEYTYSFFVDGEAVVQNTFLSDKDALAYAEKEAEKRGKKVKVARWLECVCTAQQSFAPDGLTPLAKKEVEEIVMRALATGSV